MEQENIDKYCLPRFIAEQCLACCIQLRSGVLSNPNAQEALEHVDKPDMIEDTEILIDYIQAMVDSGVPTVTVPEEMRDTYDFLYDLTMKLTIINLVSIRVIRKEDEE